MGYMSYYLTLLGPLAAVCIGFALGLLQPVRRQRRTERREEAKPAVERREPRDTSRPYPRPVGISPDDERLTLCPVCGMEDPLFLDGGPDQGDLMGWPAHRTCVEWLGGWKPRPEVRRSINLESGAPLRSMPPPARPYLGGTVATMPALLTPEWATSRAADFVSGSLQEPSAGIITLDELRERIVGTFGYPSMTFTATSDAGTVTCDCGMTFHGSVPDLDRSMEVHRTSGQHEQRMAYEARISAVTREPVSRMWCTCGKEFSGTPVGIKAVMDAHHHSGECPHSAAGRQGKMGA